MSNNKTKYLVNQDKELVGYKITKGNGETFSIPVVNGVKHPDRAAQMIKNNNSARGSKFLRPSFSLNGMSYQVSRKS